MSSKILKAMRAYHNPSCLTIADFKEDYSRPSKIKRLLGKWRKSKDDLNVGLVIAHIIAVYNVFNTDFATPHLYERCGPENRTALNTFLVVLARSWDFVDVDRELQLRIKAHMER